jgi:hypothetical protein
MHFGIIITVLGIKDLDPERMFPERLYLGHGG